MREFMLGTLHSATRHYVAQKPLDSCNKMVENNFLEWYLSERFWLEFRGQDLQLNVTIWGFPLLRQSCRFFIH